MRFGFVLLVISLVAAPGASAANFPGWQRETDATSVTVTSPTDGAGAMVRLALGVAERETGDPKAAFKSSIDQQIAAMGGDMKLSQRSGVKVRDGLMVEALKIRASGDVDIDLLIMAYPTGGSFYQALMLAYPSSVTDSDPRVAHALDFIAAAVSTRYRLTDPKAFDRTAPPARANATTYSSSSAPPKPATPPAATPSSPATAGKTCERRPVWGLRVSPWCKPSGICNDLVIKDYQTVCR